MKNSNKRSSQFILNIVTSFFSWGWPVMLSFLITPFILRYIGKDSYGIRGLIASLSGYFALFDLGLSGAGTKYLAEFNAQNDRSSIKKLLSTTLVVYTTMGLVGGLIIWFSASWICHSVFKIPPQLVPDSVTAFKLAAIGFLMSMITWWCTSIPTGLQRYDVFNMISIFYGTCNIAGNFIAAWLGYGIVGILYSNLIANTLAIILYLIYAKKLLPDIKIRFSFDKAMFKKTMSFGIYMIGFSLFAIIFDQLDKTLIGVILGTTALTYYLIPMSISGINQQVNGKIMQIFFPMASELSAQNNFDRLHYIYMRSLNLSLIIGLSVSIPLIAFSYPILNLWISADMASHAQITMIILVFSFLMAGVFPYNIITGMGHAKYFTYSAMVSGISGLIFFYVCIKLFGGVGAAIGKLLSVLITDVYYVYISMKILKITFLQFCKAFLWPLVFAAIISAGFLKFEHVANLYTLVFFSLLSVLLFVGSMWITGQINIEEKNLILRPFKNLKKVKVGNSN